MMVRECILVFGDDVVIAAVGVYGFIYDVFVDHVVVHVLVVVNVDLVVVDFKYIFVESVVVCSCS